MKKRRQIWRPSRLLRDPRNMYVPGVGWWRKGEEWWDVCSRAQTRRMWHDLWGEIYEPHPVFDSLLGLKVIIGGK